MTGRRNSLILSTQTTIDRLPSTVADMGPQLHVPGLIHTLTPVVLIQPSRTFHNPRPLPHLRTLFLHLLPPRTPSTRRYQSSHSLRTLGPPQVLTYLTPDSTSRFHPPHLISGSTSLISWICPMTPDPILNLRPTALLPRRVDMLPSILPPSRRRRRLITFSFHPRPISP